MKFLRPFAGTLVRLTTLSVILAWSNAPTAEPDGTLPPTDPSAAALVPAGPIQDVLALGKLTSLKWGNFSDVRADLNELYAQNGGKTLWLDGGNASAQASAMIEALGHAGAYGLDVKDYDPDGLQRALSSAGRSPRDAALFDVGLSVAAMRFLNNIAVGRVDPRSVSYDLDVQPRRPNLPRFVREIAHGVPPAEIVESLEPKFPLYRSLKEALARYQELAKAEALPHFALPVKFKPGNQHADVPPLRRYLQALGDLTEIDPSNAESKLYDPALADAVKNFQQRHGLGADGVIGGGTLQALNVPPGVRAEQIQLGMERLRWLPEQRGGTRLLVNVPAFQLFGFRDGSPLGRHDLKMNVIVGASSKDERHTPVFDADMTYISFRPYWNVPPSIAKKELLPILQRNPGYLARNNMELVGSYAANAGAHAPSAVNLAKLSTGALRIRQKPGPKNALGLVKFAFPNHNNVYLHSTPNKSLFKSVRRDFSHGCIRVEDPPGLAEFLLSERDGWSRGRIDAAFKASDSKIVNLPEAVHVVIFYSTVLADEQGRATFYQDIYGHDARLKEELAKGFPYAVVKRPQPKALPDTPAPENPSLRTAQTVSVPVSAKLVSEPARPATAITGNAAAAESRVNETPPAAADPEALEGERP